MKSEYPQNTALKLINKYADSYNLILEENKQLKRQIDDLKSNLLMNKDIISNIFKDLKNTKKPESSSYSQLLKQLSNENMNIYKQMDKISNERDKLRAELIQIKEEKISCQDQLSQENYKLKTQLFVLQQEIEKKNNIIQTYKKTKIYTTGLVKIPSDIKNNKKRSVTPNKSSVQKENLCEIFISNPNKALLILNNQMIYFKDMCEKLKNSLVHKKQSINKYENVIKKYEMENINLKKRFKTKLINVNKEKENMMTIITQNMLNNTENNQNYSCNNILNDKKMKSKLILNTTNNQKLKTIDDQSNLNINNLTEFIQKNGIKSSEELKQEKEDAVGKDTTIEEFSSILKNVGLTRELFEKLSKIKGCSKLTDSIEFFYKLVLDKNKQISILETQNEELLFQNFELNKKNIELENLNNFYKNGGVLNINKYNLDKINKINSIYNKNDKKIINDSMSNNYSNFSQISKSTSNTLMNYKKLIEKQREEEIDKKNDIIFDLNLSTEQNVEPSNGIKDKKKSNNEEDNKNTYVDSEIESSIKKQYEKNGKNMETIQSIDFRKGVQEEIKRQQMVEGANPNKMTFADSIRIID